MTPSTAGGGGGREGWRWSQRHAFPRHRAMARRRKSWLVGLEASGTLTRWAMDFPMERMSCIVSWPKPPKVSATMGRKFTPVDLQAERWAVSLRWTPTSKACPGVEAAPWTVLCWRGEMICTSNSAGRP